MQSPRVMETCKTATFLCGFARIVPVEVVSRIEDNPKYLRLYVPMSPIFFYDMYPTKSGHLLLSRIPAVALA